MLSNLPNLYKKYDAKFQKGIFTCGKHHNKSTS
jgi:hypothetical protein